MNNQPRLFVIKPCGDPFNRNGWDILEHENSFDEPTATFRGDISPIQGKRRTVQYLRMTYPGCRIREE